MNRQKISSVLWIMIWSFSPLAWGQYQGGVGTDDDPYLIGTFEQLQYLAQTPADWNMDFKLVNNIQWNPAFTRFRIGTIGAHFTGTFDGDGHCVEGFTYTYSSGDYVGFFGFLGVKGVVKNLGVTDVNIIADDYVGSLVGYNVGRVLYCFSDGQVCGDEYIGGLAGYNKGTVSHCYARVDTSGHYEVGGLIGEQYSGRTNECYAVGPVSDLGSSSYYYFGGLIGNNWGSGAVTNSFWDKQTSGRSRSEGGTGRNTTQMQQIENYQQAGWDFVGTYNDGIADVWFMPVEANYPDLWWQAGLPILQPVFPGGDGSADDPYWITCSDDLRQIVGKPVLMDKCFKLTDNIDLQGEAFSPIGNRYEPFEGLFDGQGYYISHLSLQSLNSLDMGLFACIDTSGRVKDLRITDANVVGGNTCGIMAGTNSGTITNCGVTGWVRGDGLVGGLVGQNQGLIKTSCSEVHIISQGSTGGGLVGVNSGTIQASYAQGQGEVSGWSTKFAGLVGSNSGHIEKSYAAVRMVVNSGTAGGLCVQNTGTVFYSFWDTEFSEQNLSMGGQRRTTAQMVQELTYLNWNTSTEAPWIMDENQDYPRLYWENPSGHPIPAYQLADLLNGSGSPEDSYLISTAEDLRVLTYFPDQWNRHFKLTNNIDFSSIDYNDFTPIGFSEEHPFTGVFDGNDYRINMMTLQFSTLDNLGLFGFIGEQAVVKNLNLDNALVEGVSNIGILAGVNRGAIRNCHSDGQVYGSSGVAGGLVGTNEDGRIMRCSSTADIMGYLSAGGLVGCNHGLVDMSYAAGLVVGDNSGGLVGYNNAGRLSNCYATASVVGDNISGLVGTNAGAIVICCYAGGHLLGESGVGGLIALYDQPEYNVVQGSFWNSQDTRQSFSIGGLGLTRDEMTSIDTYQFYRWDIAPANLATDEVWIMPDSGGYPLLSWDQDNGLVMPPFAQGSGSESDPYLIKDVNDLLALRETPSLMDKSFRLTCDLDLQEVHVPMIGGGGVPFVGTFDGANHTLSNLTLDANDMTMVGLFAFIGKGGSVKNLGLFNVQIEGQEYLGGIAGINQGTIDNCFVTGSLRGDRAIGGIAGWNAGTISLSISVVELEGYLDLGELAGVTGAPEINTSPPYARRR